MRVRVILLTVVALVFGGAAVLVLFSGYQVTREQHADSLRKHAALAAQHRAAFDEDQRLLAADAFFARASRPAREGEDAAVFLRSKLCVDAEPARVGDEQAFHDDDCGWSSFPLALHVKLGRGKSKEWIEELRGADLSTVDTAWLSELGRFGFWELSTTARDKPISPMELGVPSGVLDDYARAHLVRGLERGELAAAVRDVEELARLCVSTENTLGSIVAVSLLQRAAAAVDFAQAKQLAQREAPSVRTAQLLRRANRAAMASVALADLHSDDATAAIAAQSPWGRCAALFEAGLELMIVSGGGGSAHEVTAQRQRRIIDDSPCRLTLVRRALGDPKQRDVVSGPELVCEPGWECVFSSILVHIGGDEIFYSDPTNSFEQYVHPLP